ncbi:lactate dehydrogenase [Photobacterium japonica]|uniref:lactate dehydrogenase n=1 Tax=Photobacterium japonica TaxID=2910235 RepID=UPI003D0D60E4
MNTHTLAPAIPLLPKPYHGLQLNHCKTVSCKHFGSHHPEHYVLQRSNPDKPILVCRECGAFPPILNNQDVADEVQRLTQHQYSGLSACRHDGCPHAGLPVLTHRHLYHAFGFSGDRQRYRCKSCQTTFVDRWSGNNAKLTLQQTLLALLFTGHAVRDICRRLALNPKTFYEQIEQIASRCRHQLALFDARFCKQADHLSLASDLRALQPGSHNGVHWIASCEAQSGYVLAQDVNYQRDDHAPQHSQHDPYTHGTRFMTSPPPVSAAVCAPVHETQGLLARVDATYRDVLSRPNLEDPLSRQPHLHMPKKGCLIRPQYTVYAHYLHLQDMLTDNTALAIFMPQEPLLRSACISVFLPRIQANTVDPVYVETDPLWQHGQAAGRIDIVLMSWWRDRWAFTRHDDIGKGICHLGGKKDNAAYWLQTASHHTITDYQQRFEDQFHALVHEPRRKLRPAGLLPLLDIYRAWHNLCRQNKVGVTPAQQLGLVSHPLTLAELLR